jgi:prolyl 4-hydroxylase
MAAIQGLATPEICDWLIARAQPRLEAAQIYEFDGEKSNVRAAVDRSNSVFAFGSRDRDLVIAVLRARIAQVIPAEIRAMEAPEVLRYTIGQEYRPHYDRPADPNAPGIRKRMISLLMSLRTGYEGGETVFPLTGRRWKGRQGNAIFFWNVTRDGARDRLSLHAARPVTQGEKWIYTQFIDEPRQSAGERDAPV